MKLEALTRSQCQKAREWRNEVLETLRTPYPLTCEQQDDFYLKIICDRSSPHRYWAIVDEGAFLGMGGLTYIDWRNRHAEISLIVNPTYRYREHRYGEEAVGFLLKEAFNTMGLKTVYGECYHCNEAGAAFWSKITARCLGFTAILPNRKFWDGKFWDSLYFSIDVDNWRQVTNAAT